MSMVVIGVGLAAATLTAGALAMLIGALSPSGRWAVRRGRRAHDIAVARAQLAELESDRARGLIGDNEFRAARIEIERRLLSAANGGSPADDSGLTDGDSPAIDRRARRWTATVLIILLPLGSGGLYVWLGMPGLPGVTHAERLQSVAAARQALAEGAELTPAQLDALVADLAARLAAGDGDADGWRMLARGYRALAVPALARRALEDGLARHPDNGALLSDYADLLMDRNDGAAAAVLDKLLAGDGDDPSALWRRGLVAAGLGRPREAADYWRRLLNVLPAGANPQRGRIEQALAALRQIEAGTAESP